MFLLRILEEWRIGQDSNIQTGTLKQCFAENLLAAVMLLLTRGWFRTIVSAKSLGA